jgi:hypothetical protein
LQPPELELELELLELELLPESQPKRPSPKIPARISIKDAKIVFRVRILFSPLHGWVG